MTLTAPDVSRQHGAALAAMLSAALAGEQAQGRYRVYVGEVTTPEAEITYPYLVVWPSPAYLPTNTMAGYDGAVRSTIQITAAGVSVDEVLAALDRVGVALHRRRPQITGRNCSPLTQLPGAVPPAPNRDEHVHTPDGRPVFYSFALYQMQSTAA